MKNSTKALLGTICLLLTLSGLVILFLHIVSSLSPTFSATPLSLEIPYVAPANQLDTELIPATNSSQNKTLKKSGSTKDVKIIELSEDNSVVLRGIISARNLAPLMQKMLDLSHDLSEDDIIYLVMDTPGGGLLSGNSFIDFCQGLPQEIHTITLFSASMGFHIVQNLDKRYITPGGVLMSHRAHISGLSGSVPGNAVSEINFLLKIIDLADKRIANRLGMSIPAYRNLIWDEYWVEGPDAFKYRMADELVLVKCNEDLAGNYTKTLNSFLGKVTLTWSRCPLIRAPIDVNFDNLVFPSTYIKIQALKFFNALFFNRRIFVKDYIITNTYRHYLP